MRCASVFNHKITALQRENSDLIIAVAKLTLNGQSQNKFIEIQTLFIFFSIKNNAHS